MSGRSRFDPHGRYRSGVALVNGEVEMGASNRDPVCGMPVDPATARTFELEETLYSFCSDYCRDAFRRNPDSYVAAAWARRGEEIVLDVWLNTPQRPLEASGTSGMKAAHNGVPSLSVLDGWWIEGHIEGVTGWSIGQGSARAGSGSDDAADLYAKLPVVLETFQDEAERWAAIMSSAIALNASFFNTQRMVLEYATTAYLS